MTAFGWLNRLFPEQDTQQGIQWDLTMHEVCRVQAQDTQTGRAFFMPQALLGCSRSIQEHLNIIPSCNCGRNYTRHTR